jgi:hypothetical protein
MRWMSGRNWRGKNEAEKGEKYKSTDPNADPEKHFSFFRDHSIL